MYIILYDIIIISYEDMFQLKFDLELRPKRPKPGSVLKKMILRS